MPKTQQPAAERRARMDEKARQNEAVYQSQAGTRQGEERGYEKLQQQNRVLSGDNGVPELFPSGNPPGTDIGVLDEMDETAVSPEEQREYDQIVTKATEFVYNNPKQVMDAINDTSVPIHQGVGRVIANIGQSIENSAQASGKKLSPDTMFHAGHEIAAVILDLGVEAGILPLDPESEEYQKILGLSMMEATKAFGERMIADPKKGPVFSAEAQDAWAYRAAEEVDQGKADQRYMEMVKMRQSPLAGGIHKALRDNSGA